MKRLHKPHVRKLHLFGIGVIIVLSVAVYGFTQSHQSPVQLKLSDNTSQPAQSDSTPSSSGTAQSSTDSTNPSPTGNVNSTSGQTPHSQTATTNSQTPTPDGNQAIAPAVDPPTVVSYQQTATAAPDGDVSATNCTLTYSDGTTSTWLWQTVSSNGGSATIDNCTQSIIGTVEGATVPPSN